MKPSSRGTGGRTPRETPPTLVVDAASGPHPAILRLCRLIEAIPEGRVCTYGALAEGIGWPRYARLVGRFLKESPMAQTLPWHRVVGAGGRIAPRVGTGPDRQRSRLEREGVAFSDAGRVWIAKYAWKPSELA
ncbi:MAG TPA: MGMT family protein [Phycisphaerae bacterium]|nr:MGMT family protein [Phycisphaerae bacterium]HRW52863.1 MGMT family protein [Phycisphaerae bacterium]